MDYFIKKNTKLKKEVKLKGNQTRPHQTKENRIKPSLDTITQ